MGIKLDTYSYRARVLPVYLSLAPIVLLLAVLAPEGLKLPLGGATALVFVPISFFLSQVGADFGKRLEKGLWATWGGPPTTRFLRHGNQEFNDVTRSRIHAKLRGFGLTVPTHEDQEIDPRSADQHFEACTEELIRRTRDVQKFPLVFKGLTEYGFRRNLLGLKPLGLLLAIIGLGCSAWSIFNSLANGGDTNPVSIVAGLIIAGLLLSWFVWVTERTVNLSANRYARYILEASLDME